jgi:tRNA nucleotidyltransferase/poly(A) polymerase
MDNKVIEMMRKVRRFTKKADASWDGGGGTGILAPDYMGLGFGYPGGGGEGLGNQINLPPSHQGHPGNLAAGPWSGDSNVRERFQNEFVRKEMPADWTPEDLITEIKTLIKINTPESRDKAMFLKNVLDDKMRRMKAARRVYDSLNFTKNAELVAELKQDAFVRTLFAEHGVVLEKLDELQNFPEELTHFALHNLVHSILAATELQPLQFTPDEQEIVDKVRDAAEALSVDIYLVGGFIRDRISSRDKEKEEAGDLDFMCEHDTQKVIQYLVKKHGYKEPVEYSRSKAIMLNMDEHPIDFIDAKRIYRPLKEEGYSTLEEEEDETVAFDDAYRRDLTVNALMYDVRKSELLDPTGRGIKDLKEGVLNTIIDPFIKFRVHAPDMLRALRFAATLGFKLGPNMLEAMKANAERVRPRDQGGDISNRRVRKELRKAIDKPEHWAKMRQLLQEAGLDIILAEDIQDVQEDFEGGIEYRFDDEKSKLLEKQKEEKAMVKRFTKKAIDDRIPVGLDYYLLPLSSRAPIMEYSLVWKDSEKKQPDRVVGFVSFNSKINTWSWKPMLSDYVYGKFSAPELAAEELIKKLSDIKGFTKESGMFDWLVGKKPPTLDILHREEEGLKKKREESKKSPVGLGVVSPASKAEQVKYLAHKIDQQLPNIPSKQHEQFILSMLAQYKIGRSDPRYAEILSLLQNYGRGISSKEIPPISKEVEWRD